ncbi:PilZ domain-containing protein [Sphingomonas citri]|uniref:PilZ domain-containing protein n=1 Tax=Sphingomonas citri TaxID=2862499 RepID=A0ABS7BPU3_9SPHN|nr:PilZ domain-containing protein [Sphingomonas citri]MBW6531492.1 PilZ domain-containing protein [Sphingomonas citri]
MIEVAARVYRTRRAGERYDTDAPTTLRGASQVPLDVVVDQISLSGCHIVTPEEVSVGELISLGIAGLGRVEALVVRRTRTGYGCAFISHVPPSLLARVGEDTPVVALSDDRPLHVFDADADVPDVEKLPIRTRFLLIAGFCALSWIAIITFIAAI